MTTDQMGNPITLAAPDVGSLLEKSVQILTCGQLKIYFLMSDEQTISRYHNCYSALFYSLVKCA
jgi:hypothetical protein